MQPPIASPWGAGKPGAPLSKRVEWDAERACFVLRYVSPFWGVLRCELYSVGRKRASLFLFTLGLPLVLPLMAIQGANQHLVKPGELSVHAEGLRDETPGTIFATKWENMTQVLVHNGDLLVDRDDAHNSNFYQCRETFADVREVLRLHQIVESLRASNGANWEAVARQFRT